MLIAETVFVLLLWPGFIGKGLDKGFDDFFRFLTNWIWLVNTIFYTVDLALGYWWFSAFRWFSAIGIWIVNGVNWTVFWLVFVLLRKNVDIVLDMTKARGGELTLGEVLIGDRVYHVFPTLHTVGWILLRHWDLVVALGWLRGGAARPRSQTGRFLLLWILAGIAGPVIILAAYRVLNDPEEVYDIELPEVGVIIGVIFIIAVINGATIYLSSPINIGVVSTTIRIFFDAVWIAVLWILPIIWLVKRGFTSFAERPALWTWTYAAFYYVLDALPLYARGSVRSYVNMRAFVAWALLWPLVGLTWITFWLTFIVLADNALPMVDINEDGQIQGSELLIDRLIHVVPAIVLIIHLFVRRRVIGCWARYGFLDTNKDRGWFIVYLVWLTVGIPLVLIGSYRSIFDPSVVFETDVHDGLWFLGALLMTLLFAFMPAAFTSIDDAHDRWPLTAR